MKLKNLKIDHNYQVTPFPSPLHNYESAYPARGEIILATCLDNKLVGESMHDTMGLKSISDLAG